MYEFNWRRAAIAFSLLVLTIFAVATGNETIQPTAAVLLLLSLQYLPVVRRRPSPLRLISENGTRRPRNASSVAVAVFTGAFAVLSLVLSLFLPTLAHRFDWEGIYVGDFVRVTINDSHEFAYAACLLLLLRAGFGALFRFRSRARA